MLLKARTQHLACSPGGGTRSASDKGVASEGGIANVAQSPLVLKFGRSLSTLSNLLVAIPAGLLHVPNRTRSTPLDLLGGAR